MNGTFNQNKPGRFSNNGKVFHGTSFQLLLFVTGPRFCDSLEACLDRDGTYIYIYNLYIRNISVWVTN